MINNDNVILDALLSYDPIAAAEKMSGKSHWSTFDDKETDLAIGLVMLSGDAKREALKKANDTYFGMSFQEFVDLITANGFKKALQYTFNNISSWSGPTDEFAVYYRGDGFVITFDSFGDSLNSGKIYGICRRTTDRLMDLIKCSITPMGNSIFGFSKDVREGMFYTINNAKNSYDVLPIWPGPGCFHWMLDRTEHNSGDESYESWSKRYREISLEKISRCPEDFQKIVAGYVDDATKKIEGK